MAIKSPIVSASGQVPPASDTPVQVVAPSNTEALAIRFIRTLFDQAWKELVAFQSDVAKAHPGYAFNPNTSQIEPVKAKPAELPAPLTPVTTDSGPIE